MERGKIRVVTKCAWCKMDILNMTTMIYVRDIGSLHEHCSDDAMTHYFEQARKEEEVVRVLFIDQGNRNIFFFDVQKESKELFPELSFDVTYKTPEKALEELNRNLQYDFVFLDAGRMESLVPIINHLAERKKELRPRMTIFYGWLTTTEEKFIEKVLEPKLTHANIFNRVIPIKEVVFSKFQEVTRKLLPATT